jgi:tetratricopeptide (TPR) repeat protein
VARPDESRVVLDFDSPRPGEPPIVLLDRAAVPEAQRAAVERARAAYRRGNERMFASDEQGAIRAYEESLREYAKYAAAQRGLGVAWGGAGDPAKAIAAYQAYLALAPDARDAPLIQTRIAHLQKKKR